MACHQTGTTAETGTTPPQGAHELNRLRAPISIANTIRQIVWVLSLSLLALPAVPLPAQDEPAAEPEAPLAVEFVAPKQIDMLIGLKLTTSGGQLSQMLATTVFPTAWPEQQVEIIESQIPSVFKASFRDLPGGNQQLLLYSQLFPARTTLEATVKVRITKSHTQLGDIDTTTLKIPRRLSRDLRQYTTDSPFIKVNSSEVRKIVREIDEEEAADDWTRVERYYDWVRENIRYENGALKSVQDAIEDQTGDCEEMTSTFVALCRASKIPARCVWIPNHCYPEFYLEDEQGEGHWFPCQAAGTRNFGSMPEYLPILQKGDRFKVPEKPELQRYLAEFMSAKRIIGTGDPKVEFIRSMLGDAANLKAPDLDGAAQDP